MPSCSDGHRGPDGSISVRPEGLDKYITLNPVLAELAKATCPNLRQGSSAAVYGGSNKDARDFFERMRSFTEEEQRRILEGVKKSRGK